MSRSLAGQTALVTGASSGLGAEFARQLAFRGCDVVLVARRETRLAALKAEIDAAGGSAEYIAMDLAQPDAPLHLHHALSEAGVVVDLLVNDAGFGIFGEFLDTPWERVNDLLAIDIVALTHLTHLFAADMARRRFGHILLVASTGAYQPVPLYAVYSAAKAYVLSLGDALHVEFAKSGVACTVLSPGVTRSEFHQVAKQQLTPFQLETRMEADEVVRLGIEAMLHGRASIVAGWRNTALAWASRLGPRQVNARVAMMAMKRARRA